MKFLFRALLLLGFTVSAFSQELEKNNHENEEINFIDLENDLECRRYNGKDHHDVIDIGDLEPILSAESEPLTTVKGCVNVLSGEFFQVDNDLTSETIEPLNLFRYYDSGNESESLLGYGCGTQFPIWASDLQNGARHCYVMISEREGFLIPYQGHSTLREKICVIDPRLLKKGYTNLCRAAISGHANFVNWRAHYPSKGLSSSWTVQMGDGTQRIYDRAVKIDKEHRKRMNFTTNYAYMLTKEIKPNGNQLLFSYDSHNLVKIETLNRDGATLNSLSFKYSPHHCIVTNSDGDQVEYHLEEKPSKHDKERKVLTKVESSQKGAFTYHSKMVSKQRKIVKVEKPEGRYIQVEYDKDDKVKSIYEPLGANSQKIKSVQFDYQENHTKITNALGKHKTYNFDSYQRLSSIVQHDHQKHCNRHEIFLWSSSEGQDGWLTGKAISEGDQTYHLKT